MDGVVGVVGVVGVAGPAGVVVEVLDLVEVLPAAGVAGVTVPGFGTTGILSDPNWAKGFGRPVVLSGERTMLESRSF